MATFYATELIQVCNAEGETVKAEPGDKLDGVSESTIEMMLRLGQASEEWPPASDVPSDDPPAEEPPVDYESMTKAELVALATERGLPATGNKAELVAELTASDVPSE